MCVTIKSPQSLSSHHRHAFRLSQVWLIDSALTGGNEFEAFNLRRRLLGSVDVSFPCQ
jgi:hypothetical protein